MKQSSRVTATATAIILSFHFGNVFQCTRAVRADTGPAYHKQCTHGETIEVVSAPVGLQNLGNTCYLNAQLQCAFQIPRVRQLIMKHSPSIDADDSSHGGSISMALLALRGVFGDMLDSAASGQQTTSPAFLCSTLGIRTTEQQDSQEFWKLLLPALQLPALTDLYQGAYEDYIVALDGSGRERRREETFLDLSLDITSGSVMNALRAMFGSPELLSATEGNGWRPESGGPQIDAHKGSRLRGAGLPSILQLHLKRFHFDWMTEKTSKLYDPCSFPLTLDLSPLVVAEKSRENVSDDWNMRYELQAVVVHVGEYASGHYYAYVRPDCRSETWYRVNDEVVTKVDFNDVAADAYGGPVSNSEKPGLLARFRQLMTASRASYGFGGPTSSAYVLQYVLKRNIPTLYDDVYS